MLITVVLNAYLRCLHKFNKKAQVVVCTQPLTEFTLGKRSLSTDEQFQILCSCIWDSFPVGGWERRIAKKSRMERTQGGVERHSFMDLEKRLNSVAATAYEPLLYC